MNRSARFTIRPQPQRVCGGAPPDANGWPLPLLAAGFFAAMAVTIMGRLGFASVLTLIGVPVHYHIYLRKERRADRRAALAMAAT